MKLRSLELQGFKTFPDRIKLKFLNGISAVVGPNGSGKSNISDAIRWVLGEQSVKTLRCSKMEDVIFSGTKAKKAQNFAEVVLTLENNEENTDSGEREIVITRRYYRSGDSEYLINNKQVRLKDLNELFMDTGLGKDGYCVIGQGKIDSIVSAKSDERRELFEEAAGISKYKHRKEEANKKLLQSEENFLRIRDILSELELRVGPLEKQSQKAQKYIVYVDEKKSLEIGIWLKNLLNLSDLISNQKIEVESLINQKKEIDCMLEEIGEKIDCTFSGSNNVTVSLDINRKNVEAFKSEISSAENEYLLLENEIKHNKESIHSLDIEINEMCLSNKKFQEILLSKKQKLEVKSKQVGALNLQLTEKEKSLIKITENFQNSTLEYNETLKKVNELEQTLSKNNVDKILCESSINNFKEKQVSVKNLVKDRKVQLENLSKEISEKDKQIAVINEKVAKISEYISSQKVLYKEKNIEYNSRLAKCDEIELNFKNFSHKIEILEDMDKNMEGFSLGVKSILKEAESDKLSGICGTVSAVIDVAEEYAVAIDTALGATIQNIIVDKEDDAKSAIQFLKSKKIGRATFLPLNTIKGKKIFIDNLGRLKGFVGLASELCICESKYNSVIEYLLGRVIVADNLDNAVVISKNMSYKYKVVTLDGQVINSGGSLTGGANVKSSGTLTRNSKVKKLKKECEKYNIEKQLLQADLIDIKNQLVSVENDINEKYNLEVEEKEKAVLLKNEINNLKFKKEAYKQELDANLKALEEISFNIESYDAKMVTFSEKENEVNQIMEKLKFNTNSIQEINKEFLKNKDILNECINNLKISTISTNKEIEAINSEIISYTQSIKSSNKKINDLSNKKSMLDKQNKVYVGKIEIYNSEIEALKDKINNCNLTDRELKVKRMELEKVSVNLRKQERDLLNKREALVKDLTLMEERSNNFIKKQDEVVNKLWDEYGLTKSEAEEFTNPVEDLKDSDRRLSELKMKIKNLGAVNLEAVEEFKEVSERYNFLSEQVVDIEKSKKELKTLISSLTEDMKNIFTSKFEQINKNFSSIFKELFGGGEAHLIIIDPQNVLESGIEISVNPPGKLVSYLDSLSGGEKALVAIALYFAIMKVNPAPFCVLDEIEAALDDVNVSRFASYLRKINDKTQFVIITHRRGTMEEADILYGVTMQDDGISKVLKLNANNFVNK